MTPLHYLYPLVWCVYLQVHSVHSLIQPLYSVPVCAIRIHTCMDILYTPDTISISLDECACICNVFTWLHILYTHWYNLYSLDFTCRYVLYTHLYNLWPGSLMCVPIGTLYTHWYDLYTDGCDVFTCR